MKTRRFILNFAWLMIFSLILPGASNAMILFDMPLPGHLTGRVYNETNSQPVKNAHIALFTVKDSSMVAGTISGTEGDFSLTVLDSGKYYIEITLPGFNMKRIGPMVFSSRVEEIRLGDLTLKTVIKSKNREAGLGGIAFLRNKPNQSSGKDGLAKGPENTTCQNTGPNKSQWQQ
jgi:hypothetical protein